MRSFVSLRNLIPLLALSFILFAVGCGDDDNPVDSDNNQNHLEAIGTMLILGQDTLVTVNGTQVSGDLEVLEGDTLGPIEVRFLNPDDNTWYDPTDISGNSHSLRLEENNTDVANILVGSTFPGVTDQWEVGIVGVEGGTTSARVKIFHIDHPDYTSPLIPIHVQHGDHESAAGLRIDVGGHTVMSVDGSNITGELSVPPGETVLAEVFLLDPDGEYFQPDELNHSLGFTFADENVLSGVIDGSNQWAFNVTGHTEGETTVTIRLIHEDHPDYTSPALPAHCEEEHENAVGCKLVLDGVDAVVADGSNITGSLDLITGATTGLISVWFLSPDGDWFQPEEDHFTLGTTISGTNFALDADAGDRWQFTATGTSEGAGQLQVRLLHEGHADFTSPQLPVKTVNGN